MIHNYVTIRNCFIIVSLSPRRTTSAAYIANALNTVNWFVQKERMFKRNWKVHTVTIVSRAVKR